MVVVGYYGVFCVFAAHFDVGEPRRYYHFLLIYAFLYVYYFVIFHECAAHFNGLVDGSELAGAVSRNHQRVGIVIRVGCVCRKCGQCRNDSDE